MRKPHKRPAAIVAAALAAAAATVLGAAGGSVLAPGHTAHKQGSREQDGSAASATGGDWPVFGGSPDNTRYSSLNLINTSTVGGLRIAWTRSAGFGHTTWESFPLVVGGRMYVTTDTNAVWALDAATGARLWTYTPRVDFSSAFSAQGSHIPANRGVAVAAGRVFELTFDCHLLALAAATGRLLWRASVADPRQGYYETTAPTVWGGLVFAGSSGGDSGARGFVAAYDARTGREVWRRFTVPPRGHGWLPRGGHHGGGAVWMPPTVDSSTGVLYAGTGNPSPDFSGAMRPGRDPYTDGILALRARTGRLLWFTSLAGHDVADYDAASPVVLMRVRRPGRKPVRAVGEAGKSGRYYILDAATGRRLFAPTPFVTVSSPSPPSGAVSSGTVRQCPGELGGSNYAPVAYDPGTHDAYVSGIDYCTVVRRAAAAATARHRAGQPDLGGAAEPVRRTATGTFSAVDVDSGRLRWQRRTPAPMMGGAAAAGGLVFAGSAGGVLYGFDARTGEIRWRRRLGAGFGSAPVVYAVGGSEYLAVVCGGAAISAVNHLGPLGARLAVFRLARAAGG